MKNMDNFHDAKEAIICNHLFIVSKDEWNTKEDVNTGKSVKNSLEVLRYAKSTSWAEAPSNSEEVKPIVLAIIELH